MLNRVLLAVTGLVFLTPFAQADPVTYTDSSSWNSATTNVTTVDFTSLGFEQY